MINHKNVTIKALKETLVNYSGSPEGFDETWNSLVQMKNFGFISEAMWIKFYNACCGWYVTDDCNYMRDMNNNDRIVYDYTCGVLYIA